MTGRVLSPVAGTRGLGEGHRGAQPVPVAALAGGGMARAEAIRPAAALPVMLRRVAGFHRAPGRQVPAAGDLRRGAQSALPAVSPLAALVGVALSGLAPAA